MSNLARVFGWLYTQGINLYPVDSRTTFGDEMQDVFKDGFAVVRLSLANGQRQAILDTGNGEMPAVLPGPYPTRHVQADNPDDIIDLAIEPTPAETHVLNLHAEGASYNEIARQVYGHTGGKQTRQIKEILAKFSEN